MKNIELTKEHKSKLLEMCIKLFPEYQWDFHHHDDNKLDKKKPYENFLPGFIFGWKKYENGEISEYYHDAEIFIHWFEFCMTHLSDKLASLKEESRLDIIKAADFYERNEHKHLVNYLYEEFLKIK